MRGFWVTLLSGLLLTGIVTTTEQAWAQPPANTVPAGVSNCNDMNSCLKAITTNTFATLQSVNNIPVYLYHLTEMAMSWLSKDDSDTSANMLSQFSTLGSVILQNEDKQNALQQQVIADMYGLKVADFNGNNPVIAQTVPNVNDLSFTTMLGAPPAPKLPADPYKYLQMAGGFMLKHDVPGQDWTGKEANQDAYYRYYNTVMAVQSYDAYVLSALYANATNGNTLTPTQNALISQATDSQWLVNIGGEELGKVLRQILMFNSQSYVLLAELLKTQRQLLTAQIMNNTLIIMANQMNEHVLESRARSTQIEA
jgi:hypothetical protein